MMMPRFSRGKSAKQAPIETGAILDIWIFDKSVPKRVEVKIGLLDGQFAEVYSDQITEQSQVILGMKVVD